MAIKRTLPDRRKHPEPHTGYTTTSVFRYSTRVRRLRDTVDGHRPNRVQTQRACALQLVDCGPNCPNRAILPRRCCTWTSPNKSSGGHAASRRRPLPPSHDQDDRRGRRSPVSGTSRVYCKDQRCGRIRVRQVARVRLFKTGVRQEP